MTELIPADLMADLIALDESAMPLTCAIQRAPKADDQRGGAKRGTWATIATKVPCRLDVGMGQRGQEAVSGDRLQSIAPWTVTISVSAKADDGSALVVSVRDRILAGGRTLEVVTPLGPVSYETSREIACKEVR
jgi:hypothetical protein